MPSAFNFAVWPFDCLNQDEQRLVRDAVDIGYYPEGQTILDAGAAPLHLFVIIKGRVGQYDGDELIATFGPDDCFDGRALVAGKASSRFVAAEEVVAYQVARQAVRDLIAANATFGALLFSDLGSKLSAIAQRQSMETMQSLAVSHVSDAFIRPAHFVDAGTDVVSVVKLFQAQNTSNVLVRDGTASPPRVGIFTRSSLQRAVLQGTPLDRLPVGQMSQFSLITVPASAQIGDALTLMLRHRVHRLVVTRGDEILGLLESLDVFSFLANHSYLLTVQINLAQDLDALAQVAAQITRMVALLTRGGSRIDHVASLVREINACLFERAWQMIAPPELVENSCLFVMGSEGRGEQLLKTDQDNALVLRDGYVPPPDLQRIVTRFSDALAAFGYPPCPGGIMLSRPEWCMTASDFARRIREWLILPSPEGLMHLAIFFDAHAVCGDAALLKQLRRTLLELTIDNDAVLGRFAAAVEAFSAAPGWRDRLLGLGDPDPVLDVKKEGIFPIVHGVRSLALAHHILDETGTVPRLNALVRAEALDAHMAAELSESLHFLMTLRLKAGLAEIDAHQPVSCDVHLSRLSSLERDLLKDALSAVKRFKALLRQRWRTEWM
ncbi:MAG: cyclic nucleotide-binding domain-containing protein [Actinobacteria bacterium]|nr:cyclic nucleotide-binding domain-containing protein [Actinomycetota bacterium]